MKSSQFLRSSSLIFFARLVLHVSSWRLNICSDPQLLKQEEDHLYKALSTCKYPAWALNRIKMKIRNPNTRRNNNKQKKSGTDTNQKPYITVPYQRGLSESFKRTCNNHGVQVYFKGGTTIKNLWWLQRIKILSRTEVESSTDLNVTGWSVMMNT